MKSEETMNEGVVPGVPLGANGPSGNSELREYPRDFLCRNINEYKNREVVAKKVRDWIMSKDIDGGMQIRGEQSVVEAMIDDVIKDCIFLWQSATAHVTGAIVARATERARALNLKRDDSQPPGTAEHIGQIIQSIAERNTEEAATMFREIWYKGFTNGRSRTVWAEELEREWLEQVRWTYSQDDRTRVSSSYQKRLSSRLNDMRQSARNQLSRKFGIFVKERASNRKPPPKEDKVMRTDFDPPSRIQNSPLAERPRETNITRAAQLHDKAVTFASTATVTIVVMFLYHALYVL